jgi:hypothetical protein
LISHTRGNIGAWIVSNCTRPLGGIGSGNRSKTGSRGGCSSLLGNRSFTFSQKRPKCTARKAVSLSNCNDSTVSTTGGLSKSARSKYGELGNAATRVIHCARPRRAFVIMIGCGLLVCFLLLSRQRAPTCPDCARSIHGLSMKRPPPCSCRADPQGSFVEAPDRSPRRAKV